MEEVKKCNICNQDVMASQLLTHRNFCLAGDLFKMFGDVKETKLNFGQSANCEACGDKILKHEMSNHYKNCEAREEKCAYCADFYPLLILPDHLEVCEQKKLSSSPQKKHFFFDQQKQQQQQQQQQSQKQPVSRFWNVDDDDDEEDEEEEVPNEAPSQYGAQKNQKRVRMKHPLEKPQQPQQKFQQQQAQAYQQMQQIKKEVQKMPQVIPQPKQQQQQVSSKHSRPQTALYGFTKEMEEQMKKFNEMLDKGEEIKGLEDHDMSNIGGFSAEKMNQFPRQNYVFTPNLQVEHRSCSICLEDFLKGEQILVLFCLHRFHENCSKTWLSKNPLCPVCKEDQKKHIDG